MCRSLPPERVLESVVDSGPRMKPSPVVALWHIGVYVGVNEAPYGDRVIYAVVENHGIGFHVSCEPDVYVRNVRSFNF